MAKAAHHKVDPESQQPLDPGCPRTPTERWVGLARRDVDPNRWLYRPDTVRNLWYAGWVILAGLVAADLGVHHHGEFGFDESFGFHAWFGFVACVALVGISKLAGHFLKKPEAFYDE